MTYRIELYNGKEHPAVHPIDSATVDSEKDARRIAAQFLGRSTLRGANTWDRAQGGDVYQFGRRDDSNECNFAVIIAE